jgi:hypothetical protein
MDLAEVFRNTLAGGLKRSAITLPSKWATTYRMMSGQFAGSWGWGPSPWTKEMHDSKAEMNIGQKAAQMGFTETVLNITFYKIDIENTDVLYVLPTKMPDASVFSSARFDSALELSPHLSCLFSSVNNIDHKKAGSSSLYVRGSNSRSALKSIPVGVIIFDEVDEMNQDNIPLAEARTDFQENPIIWKISTPTVPNTKINLLFNSSTQEHFFFNCPRCGQKEELIFPDNIVITADHKDDPRIKDTHLICSKTKLELPHETKREWLNIDNTAWVSKTPDFEPRGFHINQLYSIVKPPAAVALSYLKGLVDKVFEQEFHNSRLGLPHIVAGAQINIEQIEQLITSRHKTDAPPTNTIITMGVDQGNWLHYEIDAWRFKTLGPDLNMSAECVLLTEGKCKHFHELDTLMKQWQVHGCVIDAQPEKRMAYEFAVRFWGYVKLCYYAKGQRGKRISMGTEEEHTIVVDRTTWLDTALNRFHTRTIDLPQDLSEEYKSHIQNIVRHYKRTNSGDTVAEYVHNGDDHFAHTRCYAELALPLAASIQTNKDIKVFL